MGVFLSTYENKIDKKGRVSVPAPFRSALATQSFQGIVVFRSYTLRALEGFGMDRMERLSAQMDHSMALFSEEQDDLTSSIFADAQPLGFDTEGRIMLPPTLQEHADLNGCVAFVGKGATFQLWNPEHFKTHQQKARERLRSQKTSIAQGPQGEKASQ